MLFKRALDHLTEPSLIPTFTGEILYTLCKHASNNNAILPLAYFQAVSPAIASDRVLDTFFTIMCRASITETFFFSRSYGDTIHQRLFEKLLTFVHADAGGTARATRGVELISLPFSELESTWFNEFLTHGRGKTLYGSSDTVIMRNIAMGEVPHVSGDSRHRSGPKIGAVDWTLLVDNMKQSLASEYAMS